MKRLKKIFTIIIYIILISIIIAVIIIKHFSYKIKPSINKYVESEIERIITLIINDTISNNLVNIDANSFFIMNNNVMDLNNKELSMIQNNINKKIENNIRLVSSGKIKKLDRYFNTISDIDYENIEGGLVYYILAGNISGSIFTNNLGPKIPIKFNMFGDVISNTKSTVKEYGINNAMIEVRLYIKVNMIIYMPYVTRKVTVKTSMPMITRIVQGSIPDYYLGSGLR